jgi:multicomponent Na+:H+ antiporter subunit G
LAPTSSRQPLPSSPSPATPNDAPSEAPWRRVQAQPRADADVGGTGASELFVALFLVLSRAFAAIAGLGLLRPPDVLPPMHASTKAGALGVGLVSIGVAIHFNDLVVAAKTALIIPFLLLTAPVAAHLIGRAAYRSGTPLRLRTKIYETPAGCAMRGEPPQGTTGSSDR